MNQYNQQQSFIHSTKSEQIPKPFLRLLEKSQKKIQNQQLKYQRGNFTSPNIHSKSYQEKVLIFSDSPHTPIQKNLFQYLTSTPKNPEVTSFNNQDNVIQAEIEVCNQTIFGEGMSSSNQEPLIQEVNREFDLIPEILEQPKINEKYQLGDEKNLEIIQINEQLQFHLNGVEQRVINLQTLKNIHTQHFINLLSQTYQITNQITNSNDRNEILKNIKILSDLIGYFAQALPTLEDKVLQEIISVTVNLANKKVTLID